MKLIVSYVLVCFPLFSWSQDTLPATNSYVLEKGIYSNLMGFEIDTMLNSSLYKTIGEWLYTKYCFGGTSEEGIDCSDFSRVLYEKVYNQKMSGSSADVFLKVDTIQRSELHEGDLVFFKIKKNRVSHMGVYLTKNKFAHATVKSGVIISDLDEEYYKKYFYRAGRLKN